MENSCNYKNKPRFSNGKLVMLSRKNTKSGKIPYFYTFLEENRLTCAVVKKHIAGDLDRGVPILLIEDPVFVETPDWFRGQGQLYSSFTRPTKVWRLKFLLDEQKYLLLTEVWRLKFLLDEQKYLLFLTKVQYNHELVKAVPRRLEKDYNNVLKETKHLKKEDR